MTLSGLLQVVRNSTKTESVRLDLRKEIKLEKPISSVIYALVVKPPFRRDSPEEKQKVENKILMSIYNKDRQEKSKLAKKTESRH